MLLTTSRPHWPTLSNTVRSLNDQLTFRNSEVYILENRIGAIVQEQFFQSLVRFPWSACRSVLGQNTDVNWTPKLLLMRWSAPCMAATGISVWITVSCFGQKRPLNAINVNVVLARVINLAGLTFVCNPEGGLPMYYTCFLMAAGEPISEFT